MINSIALSVLGTVVGINVPLMSAGLDSIAVIELTQSLSTAFELALSPTLLFDYPTLNSLLAVLSSELTSMDGTGSASSSTRQLRKR